MGDGDDTMTNELPLKAVVERAALADRLLSFLIKASRQGLLLSLHPVAGAQQLIAVLVLTRGLLEVCSKWLCISHCRTGSAHSDTSWLSEYVAPGAAVGLNSVSFGL